MSPKAAKSSKPLEDQEWFHGHCSRNNAMALITEPGEFLVHTNGSGPNAAIVITCCDDRRKIVNLALIKHADKGTWEVLTNDGDHLSKKFASVVELVEHYRATPPTLLVKLTRPIPRPEWVLQSNTVTFKNMLGCGGYGLVYRGLLEKKSGNLAVAIRIPMRATAEKKTDSEEVKKDRAEMQREAKTLALYAHKNLVQFYGVATDKSPVLIVTEYCPGGDLLSHLVKYGRMTDEREKCMYLNEASHGLLYLHSKQITHGNLAARNCLISRHGIVKIGDYGSLYKLIDEGAQAPVRWCAPDELPPPPPIRTTRSDIWAFGILVYEVFSNGHTPMLDVPARDVAARLRDGKMPKLPGIWPALVVDLLKRLWTKQPDQQLTMSKIAYEFNDMIYWYVKSDGPFPVEKMTVNSHPGVKRSTYYDSEYFERYEEQTALEKTKPM